MEFSYNIFLSATKVAAETTGNTITPTPTTVAIVGISVVFVSLVILAVLIWLFSKIVGSFNNVDKKSTGTQPNIAEQAATKEVANTQVQDTVEADGELIAVLTAAIMASLKSQSSCELRVKSFRRIGQNSPIWNSTGRSEYIASKL